MQHTKLAELTAWVEEVAKLCQPAHIHWCTGSNEEYDSLIELMLKDGSLTEVNPTYHPRSYLHRSHPQDVARTEHLTFICTKTKEEAGPNNNWMESQAGHQKVDALFAGAMAGRTLYVIPYCMGPIDSPYARYGVEITDSAYVVCNMKIMTRMGTKALKKIEEHKSFVRGLHSTGDLSIEHRLIMHFPEERLIKSIGSGYGGNALLGKKCHALRIASHQGREEGWLAEHMLIVGIENPQGEITYVVAAFPSACGKTNLAMLIPPASYPGWKVWTVGDDIAWLHLGEDGRMYAINPEAGFFGVAPGTSAKSNPNALAMLTHDTIFTNVALNADKVPWWEGLDEKEPVVDWQGRLYKKENGPAAHPNSRFTVKAEQCPTYSPEMENPKGVPISAIIFGGRRPSTIPLVFQARSWSHGVLVGASVASETTAAATGEVGVLRHDPMAMKPFCGYDFGRYWQHWLSFADKSDSLPQVFHVNWFRKDDQGKFLWPGFGENLRVLEWIIARTKGQAKAKSSAIGYMPDASDINLQGLGLGQEQASELLSYPVSDMRKEQVELLGYLKTFEPTLPTKLLKEHSQILNALEEEEMDLLKKKASSRVSPDAFLTLQD